MSQQSAEWREYTCQQCGNLYQVLTVSPIPADKQFCFLCQKQHLKLRSYANSIGAVIAVNNGADHGEPGKQQELCDPFVITGKAKQVFKTIELKAKYESEAWQ